MARGDLCADEAGVEACWRLAPPLRGPRPVAAVTAVGKPGWENTSHRYELSDSGCANTPSSWDV